MSIAKPQQYSRQPVMAHIMFWLIVLTVILVSSNPYRKLQRLSNSALNTQENCSNTLFACQCPNDVNMDLNLLSLKDLVYTGSNAVLRRKQTRSTDFKPSDSNLLLGFLLLMLAGDVSVNPGPRPARYPCGTCCYAVSKGQRAIYCERCLFWIHLKCEPHISIAMYKELGASDEPWFCSNCTTLINNENDECLLRFSDSYFETSFDSTPENYSGYNFSDSFFDSSISSTSTTAESETNDQEDECDYLNECREYRLKHLKNCHFAYLNVNSIRYKMKEVQSVIHLLQPVVFTAAETKIDDSFTTAQFHINGYHPPLRRDRNANGGGLLTYVRSDIPCQRLDFQTSLVETLTMEIVLNKTKWVVASVYKPPKVTDYQFQSEMEPLLERLTSLYDRILVLGDMNFDLMKPEKSQALQDLMNLYDLTNLMKTPTFVSNHGSSLIDVILTNNKHLFCDTLVTDVGCSDGHSLIASTTKLTKCNLQPKTITYRSFKTFCNDKYRDDIAKIPFSICDIFDDPGDSLWAFQTLLREVLDEHAPIKSKKIRGAQPPFMNRTLRKNIMKKQMLRNRYMKNKSASNWEAFKAQRNLTTNIRRKSIKQYFRERCNDGPKSDNFYKTIKPFLSNKYRSDSSLMIQDNQNILTDPKEVADTMNNFFTDIAKDIGSECKNQPDISKFTCTKDFVLASEVFFKDHHSIMNIKSSDSKKAFSFTHAMEDTTLKTIKSLNCSKATGTDCIPAKSLTLAADILAAPLTKIFNKSVDTNTFPDEAKKAEVIPVYKKDNALEKKNHRPVSILTSISKIFENLIVTQLRERWLDDIFNDYLTAFRPNHGCQHVLIALCDKWRQAKENKQIPGILLVDLSKAFDCLSHPLTATKFLAYGMDTDATTLLTDYLTNRSQRVKLNNSVESSWSRLSKGALQGSILGPTIFNLFLNDIFLDFEPGTLLNYADDNTVFAAADSLDNLRTSLGDKSAKIIKWCDLNFMAANSSKFQTMIAAHQASSTQSSPAQN